MARRSAEVSPRSATAASATTAAFATLTTPAGVSAEEQVRALLAWAARHPERLTETRRAAAVGAFAEVWPRG